MKRIILNEYRIIALNIVSFAQPPAQRGAIAQTDNNMLVCYGAGGPLKAVCL